MSWLLFLAPHILYVNFDGSVIHGGTDCDDATTNCSLLAGPNGTLSYPSYGGSATDVQQIMAEVTQMYSAYNVQLVTARPASGTQYAMTMVGGTSDVLHQPANRIGVSLIDCGNISETNLSFVFAATANLSLHDIAVAIAQESGHGFGLAHTDNQMDVMYPYISSVATGFLDANMNVFDVSAANSDCNGTGHQNSFRQMMLNVGHSGGPDTTPPTISITAPHDGDSVASGFTIVFDANDNVFVATVTVAIDGTARPPVGLPPWQFNVASGTLPAGMHHLSATARDLDGNMTAAQDITVNVKAVGQSPGDLGSSCAHDSDCDGGGLCENGMCTHSCGTALTSCSAGFTCGSANGLRVCVHADQGGCSVGGHTSGVSVGLLLLLLALSTAGSRWLAAGRATQRR